MAGKVKRNRLGERLREAGFDLSWYDRSARCFRLRCSQCEAAAINGVACHETGCPNRPKPQREDD